MTGQRSLCTPSGERGGLRDNARSRFETLLWPIRPRKRILTDLLGAPGRRVLRDSKRCPVADGVDARNGVCEPLTDTKGSPWPLPVKIPESSRPIAKGSSVTSANSRVVSWAVCQGCQGS